MIPSLDLHEWSIMVTAADETSLAVSCMKKGAFDYRVKPFDMKGLNSHSIPLYSRNSRNENGNISHESHSMRSLSSVFCPQPTYQ